ncbi:MAG: hypothetical protein HY077_14870 [Elusimicrobia bacterium]|nr:hypothetical protein [Elusimicrobiota bacterium]
MKSMKRALLAALALGLSIPLRAQNLGVSDALLRQELAPIMSGAAGLAQKVSAQAVPPGKDRDAAQLPDAFQRLIKFQNSHEAVAARVTVYRTGYEKISGKAGRETGDWAVVLDVDDTVLDHQQYQINTEFRFNPDTWNQWVMEARAPSVAGAKEFLDKVRRLRGAHVVFITDRDDAQKAATVQNLMRNGLFGPADKVLTKAGKDDTKEVRRQCVEKATDARCAADAPMPILGFFGDSLRDFIELHDVDLTPERTEALRQDPRWGESWFVIVNPLYGQWERGYK